MRRRVRRLLQLSSKEKKQVEAKLVKLFGGSQPRKATQLPPRRGQGDGGLDGRVQVLVPENLVMSAAPGPMDIEAAFNVRVERAKFTRDELGAFVNDMDREKIRVGIIITAAGLSPDAKSELGRHNNEGKIFLTHVPLEEVLSGDPVSGLRFKEGELGATMRNVLDEFLRSSRSQSDESNEG